MKESSIPPPTTKAYELNGVSTGTSVAIGYPTSNEPIKVKSDSDPHRIFRITLAVTNTNRAAMSEYLVVMRPKNSGTMAYQYIERTAVVKNQIGQEDVNTPVLHFHDKTLKVKLSGFPIGQRVLVNVTLIYTSDPVIERSSGEDVELCRPE
jgi:hypothetical protein